MFQHKTKTAPEIGDTMPDGTIYAGISPDTLTPMYARRRDAFILCDFNEAAEIAEKLKAHGRKDWRVPTKNELDVLYQNRNKGKLKGTFNETGWFPEGRYWSSMPDECGTGWSQSFEDGFQMTRGSKLLGSLRCVR